MNTLDANHGHYGTNGVYHYHGTTASPYMIGNMVGQVMEDNTHQLVPQAAAHPVRTENWTPLSGALITSCALNTNQNGYNVLYNLNGVAGYATDYSWSGTTYTFNYLTTSGTNSINYNGFTQCSVPLAATAFMNIQNIRIYPNPAKETVFIDYGTTNLSSEVQFVGIYSIKGDLVYKTTENKTALDIKGLAKGTYLVKIQFPTTQISKKIIIQN